MMMKKKNKNNDKSAEKQTHKQLFKNNKTQLPFIVCISSGLEMHLVVAPIFPPLWNKKKNGAQNNMPALKIWGQRMPSQQTGGRTNIRNG